MRAEIECPRCNQITRQDVDLYFGYNNEMSEYKLGDKYIWRLGKAVHNGGRPASGNMDGDGYVECNLCRKDFFVKVLVRNDVLLSVETNSAKEPYITD